MSETSMSFPHPLMAPVIELALRAGEAILPFWRAGVEVTAKSDDSPVTAADLAAHHVIVAGLTVLVDPLDGTKEFISGSEEFTVNIALIENGRVVFGVVSMPTSGRFYVGGAGLGAWRGDKDATPIAIQVRDVLAPDEAFTVVASRRHSSPEQERLLAGLSASLGELQLANIGSSLKFCLLAEGAADCYPRLAPTSQWDTAAAQGVLEGAGGEVLDLQGEAFCYPARESLLNEFFLALPAKAAWRPRLLELARS